MKYLFTPAFCKSVMLEECLKHLYATDEITKLGIKHVVIDNHYPVRKQENRSQIQNLCWQYGITYIDSGLDLGLHRGLNNAMQVLGMTSGDIFLGCDPDDRPSPGALTAMSDVILDPSVAVCGLNFWVIKERKTQIPNFYEAWIRGHRAWVHPFVEMWNVAAFNMKLIFDMGGFSQPNAYYGGIEARMYHEWLKRGLKLVYLPDHTSEASPVDRSVLADPEYRQWKDEHVGGYPYSFEAWLKERHPHLL